MFSPSRTIPSFSSSTLRFPLRWALAASLPMGRSPPLSSITSLGMLLFFPLSNCATYAHHFGWFFRVLHQCTNVKGFLYCSAYIFSASSIN
uniref:Uncharacterized protein n=1 Tax=Arundo donax TaxID=35708 RepID=A0A0A8YZP2_ARUDO